MCDQLCFQESASSFGLKNPETNLNSIWWSVMQHPMLVVDAVWIMPLLWFLLNGGIQAHPRKATEVEQRHLESQCSTTELSLDQKYCTIKDLEELNSLYIKVWVGLCNMAQSKKKKKKKLGDRGGCDKCFTGWRTSKTSETWREIWV